MASNEEILSKATITTDALAAAGKLNPAQADRFIDYVMDQTSWTGHARLVKFRNESYDIDKIGLGTRNAMPAAEAQDPGTRRGVTTSKLTLTPAEIMVPFEIGDSFLEENLEGAAVEDHIIKMMARAVANDLEELYILGDVLGPSQAESTLLSGGSATNHIKDSFLGLADGWLRKADSGNLVNSAAANIGASTFSSMLRSMPTKFRRDRRNLRFIMSSDLGQLWRERVAARATGAGDSALQGDGLVNAFGVPIVEVPLMPFQPLVVEHLTFTGSGTTVTTKYTGITNLTITTSGLGSDPETPRVLTTDYTVVAATGVITHAGGGSAIGTTDTVKVTYNASPQILLSHFENFILGFSRDIRIEKDRDIFRRVNQYAISLKVAMDIEETTAVVKGYNLGTSI